MSTLAVLRPRRWRALLAAAAATIAAAGFGAAADAQAASYYTITNTGSGLALEASVDGKVRLAPPNKNNQLQQWKQLNRVNFSTWAETALENRLLGCLQSDSPTNPVPVVASLKTGICAGTATDKRKRWALLSGSNSSSPNLPGTQLVNKLTSEYAADINLCFQNCPPKPEATLVNESFIPSGPIGAYGKWSFKFATSAP